MRTEIEVLQAQVNSLTIQLEEARSAASTPSDNTQHGSVRSVVLSSKKPTVGFNKNAWAPPDEDSEEQSEETPVEAGFNRTAWAPPNGNTEE